MSETRLWGVAADGARLVAEYRNGRGSAPPVWDLLWSEHIDPGHNLPSSNTPEEDRKLWALARDPSVPAHRRLTLAFTFDLGLVPRAHLPRLAEALEAVHGEILARTAWTWSHLPAIAADLRSLAATEDRRLLGAGLGCTSISDPWSHWRPGRSALLDAVHHAGLAARPFAWPG